MTPRCEFGGLRGCDQDGAYLVTYEVDIARGSFAACVEHAAEARANDPLGYIDFICSLPRPA